MRAPLRIVSLLEALRLVIRTGASYNRERTAETRSGWASFSCVQGSLGLPGPRYAVRHALIAPAPVSLIAVAPPLPAAACAPSALDTFVCRPHWTLGLRRPFSYS